MMLEFVSSWLVCLVLLAAVVQSERTIMNMANSLFEERQAVLVWLFVNVCLAVCTAVVMWWK
jgi:Mg/Co/Ni transporter MgtE